MISAGYRGTPGAFHLAVTTLAPTAVGAAELARVTAGLGRGELVALPAMATVLFSAKTMHQWCITDERNGTAWGRFVCNGKHPPGKKP